VAHKKVPLVFTITLAAIYSFNNAFTVAFTEELQKNCSKTYHLDSDMLPHYLGKFGCLTVTVRMQLSSKSNQFRSDAELFSYNNCLSEMLSL